MELNKDLLDYFNGDALAASSWLNKYALRNTNGDIIESSPDDMFLRSAQEYFRINSRHQKLTRPNSLSEYGYNRKYLTEEHIFYLLYKFKYIVQGGSAMATIGSNSYSSLSNCMVISSPQDSYGSIMKVRTNQVQLMKRRAGVGYDLSNLRPRGATVNNSAGTSTGAASFMDVCSDITNETAQLGRRGALMLSISIAHPDVLEFITKKQDLTKVTGANISVKIPDDFMLAVTKDEDYCLKFPINSEINKEVFDNAEYNILVKDGNKYFKKVKAKKLWEEVIRCAHNTAEPGIMFETTAINYAPDGIYDKFKMISSNPCAEIMMGPNDSCRLIHLNLTSFVDSPFLTESRIDYNKLYSISYEMMLLADDFIDLELEAINRIINKVDDHLEYELWDNIKTSTTQGRRAGCGFTGLADMLAMLNLDYTSDASKIVVNKVMHTITKAQLDATIDMAIIKGAFPACITTSNPRNDWERFIQQEFPEQWDRMSKYGRRNISFSTVAPTGTVSILTQTSSGIEPVFMPVYSRKRKCSNPNDVVDFTDSMGEKYTIFTVVHPNFKKWICDTKYQGNSDCIGYIGALKDTTYLTKLFEESPYSNSIASKIDWKGRIEMQSIIQKYITHAISSTINLPNDTPSSVISDIYMEAWRLGLKGITVYRDGCRDGILTSINSKNNNNNKNYIKRPKNVDADFHTVKIKGEQFIVLVGIIDDVPYEVFTFRPLYPIDCKNHRGITTKDKNKSYKFSSKFIDITDIHLSSINSEERGLSILVSMLLRHNTDIKFILKTTKKINDNISSFSSALCRVLSKYVDTEKVSGEQCPECGGTLVREAGCVKCNDDNSKYCTWSKCE